MASDYACLAWSELLSVCNGVPRETGKRSEMPDPLVELSTYGYESVHLEMRYVRW